MPNNNVQQFTPFKRSGAGAISPKVSGDDLGMGSGNITTTGTITGSNIATSYTTGSVLFGGVTGEIAQDNTNLFYETSTNSLGIGTATPSAVAKLDLTSTTQGFLPPRMDTTARDLITAVAGLTIYNTTTSSLETYDGVTWERADFSLDIGDAIGSSTIGSVLFVGASNDLQQDNANLFWDDTNNRLGIGIAIPTTPLDVSGATNLDGAVTINESAANVNTRIETSGDPNAVFVDGASNNIVIGGGTSQGSGKLEVISGGNKGFMPPKLTSAQMSGSILGFVNIDGLIGYNTTIEKPMYVDENTGVQADWLSNESVAVAFGRNGNSDGVYLRYGGNATNAGTGWVAPYNGVIKEITAIETGGNPTKAIDIERYNSAGVLQTTTTVNLVGSQYTNLAENIIFNAGDRLNVFVSAVGVAATNVAITMMAKWRLVIIA